MNIPNILSWHWSPALGLLGLLFLMGYFWVTDNRNLRRTLLFIGGVILFEIALALPLGPVPPGFQSAGALSCALPGGTLFSLHMVRHIILLMLAPPLIVAGFSPQLIKGWLGDGQSYSVTQKLMSPWVTWPLGVGIMWFWHIPPVFNYLTTYSASIGHQLIPFAEVLSLMGIGLLFCWPILSPVRRHRLPPLKGIVYLFTACSACSMLGILITFASPGLYHTVFNSTPGLVWGVSQSVDQQLGGLLMWVPGCFVYLSGVVTLLVRWFSYRAPAQATSANQPATI